MTEAGDDGTGSDQTNTFALSRAWFIIGHKFDDVSEKVKKAFLEWVDEDKYNKDEREETTERYKKDNKAIFVTDPGKG